MLIDKTFFIENFVGTYKMEDVPEWECTMIVSKEVNHADIKAGEQPLQKKRIFDFASGDECMFVQLANVDINSDESILSFCNKYGLPCSPQVCFDDEMGLGKDIGTDTANRISRRDTTKYARNDTMDRLEFCRCAVQIHSLMELKGILEQKSIKDSERFISLLLYLLLYSREYIYEYDYDLDTYGGEHPEVLPKTRLMSFQFHFHLFRKRNWSIMQYLPAADQVVAFIQRYKYLVGHPDNVRDSMTLSDMCSEDYTEAINFLEKLFSENLDQKYNIIMPASTFSAIYSIEGKVGLCGDWQQISHTKNQFGINEYGHITFTDTVKYTGDILALRSLALQVIRDIITEGLARVSPKVIVADGKLRGSWDLKQMLEGIYLELFSQLATDAQYRLCANASCGKFFSVQGAHANKQFCSEKCANLVRQRRRRTRNREK